MNSMTGTKQPTYRQRLANFLGCNEDEMAFSEPPGYAPPQPTPHCELRDANQLRRLLRRIKELNIDRLSQPQT